MAEHRVDSSQSLTPASPFPEGFSRTTYPISRMLQVKLPRKTSCKVGKDILLPFLQKRDTDTVNRRLSGSFTHSQALERLLSQSAQLVSAPGAISLR